VTHQRKIMLEELQGRHYSEGTTRYYIRHVERFARHFNCSPDRLGPQHIREYQAYIFTKRKMLPGSVTNHLGALRFFYLQTLRRPWSITDTPYPKKIHRLPMILSQEEVAQLIDATCTPFHRTILMTLYATGVRNAELTRLKVSDMDSQRMVIHIQRGKGREDRDVMLSPVLLDDLRALATVAQKNRFGSSPETVGIVVISPGIRKRRITPARTPLAVPGLRKRYIPTCSVTASPRTCWKELAVAIPHGAHFTRPNYLRKRQDQMRSMRETEEPCHLARVTCEGLVRK
jgi:site-specific recombinase XerD